LNTSIAKKLNLLVLLILCSWTLSFAQTGKDTVQCYNVKELRKISVALVKGSECKEQLNICKNEVEILKDITVKQKTQLINKDTIISMQEYVIVSLQHENIELKEEVKMETKKVRRVKTKFGILSALLLISTGYFIFN
jgi:hypothetical protein